MLHRFLPAPPESLKQIPTWNISLNSQGFRDVEFQTIKRTTSFRIICFGDSWTFGANVGQDTTYPSQLGTLLNEEFPGKDFEVLNLGVLGYSSYQGLQLMKRIVNDFSPDLVIIGYAMNDASIAGFRDKDLAASSGTTKPWDKQLGETAERLEIYKLTRYLAARLTDRPRSLGDHLKSLHEADTGEWWGGSERRVMGQHGYDKLEPWTRVSPTDYEQNLFQMITLAKQHHAGVVLLNNALWRGGAYAIALEKIARAEQIPFIDSSLLIENARKAIEDGLEVRLALRDRPDRPLPSDGAVETIFRVYSGDYPVPKSINLAGVHPALGARVPNRIAMYDDGTHGDQRAGDRVWSYAVTVPRGTTLFYVYTNSGEEGKWEGLDVPYVRAFRVVAEADRRTIYRPIESFGTVYMQADGWHTNAQGYRLIAGALVDVLKKNDKVKAYLALKDRFMSRKEVQRR
jgi:lysophospholipase L1-like esterase